MNPYKSPQKKSKDTHSRPIIDVRGCIVMLTVLYGPLFIALLLDWYLSWKA